jgi:sugar/nucleoside kinase (ribokinase family)
VTAPAPGRQPDLPVAAPAPGRQPDLPVAALAPGRQPDLPVAAPAPGRQPDLPVAALAPDREPGPPAAAPAPDRELDLVVTGDCNPDVLVTGGDVAPAFGQQEKLVGAIGLTVGGAAAITAVAAARLGLRVALVAAIGDDPAGDFMLGQLAAAGVDTQAVAVRPGLATGMTVALSRGSDRAILTATGAMATLTAPDVPADLVGRARHLHVSSYFLLEHSLGPDLADLLGAVRRRGTTTSLDTNWDPAQRWGDDRLRAALAETDVLLPNEAEVLHLSGETSVAAAAAALTARGPRVVVKLGARGALCADGDRWYRIELPARLGQPVVDATGAGDCFNAGLIAGLRRGLDLPAAAALGCAAGTASTRAVGGTGARLEPAAVAADAAAMTIRAVRSAAGDGPAFSG